MIGAIIGDVIGSRFEKNNIKTKDFELFTSVCCFTDDTVLTIAIADCILNSKDYSSTVKEYGRAFPFAGYGGTFKKWLAGIITGPYNSWGNGSAMRVSPIGFAFNDEAKILEEAKQSAIITHNHEEGVKGAQAIAMAIFLARTGSSKQEIKTYIESKFGYDLNRTIDEIRPIYKFDVSCQGSVPESIIAFLESENFEDAIRTAISIGGDSDTIACMTGAIAEAYYKSIPIEMLERVNEYLHERFQKVIEEFQKRHKTKKYDKTNKAVDTLLGVAIGDALGVPFEFKSKREIDKNPCKDMIGYGTYSQPAGTWSDDSSLTFCLAESLVGGYDLKDIAMRFIAWRNKAHWSARGSVFDIGITTTTSISRLANILKQEEYHELTQQKYLGDESDNGNGSLMRIIPLLFYIKGKPIEEQWEIIWNVSALTHRHIRAAMCCLIYLRVAEHILNGKTKEESYEQMQKDILSFWKKMSFAEREQVLFSKIITNDIRKTPYTELKSGGYVMESIEASLWCFLKHDNYASIVLEAVNLGHDTDTTAAIAGGLAGLYYGAAGIPEHWITSLARMSDIIELGNLLNDKYN